MSEFGECPECHELLIESLTGCENCGWKLKTATIDDGPKIGHGVDRDSLVMVDCCAVDCSAEGFVYSGNVPIVDCVAIKLFPWSNWPIVRLLERKA